MIDHPELGQLEYLKIYLQIDDYPEMFVCKFNSDDKYLAVRVEEYRHPIEPKTIVHNYYFVGVNDSEVLQAEKDHRFHNLLFQTRPVWFLNYLRGMGDPVSRWKKEARMNSMYELSE